MGGRVSFTSSPIGTKEDSPLYRLVAGIQNYMYLPNPDPLYTVLGAMAGNMMTGSNIWLMLVGASSSGKTLMLEVLYGLIPDPQKPDWAKDPLKRAHITGAIKSPAALLSATSRAQRTADCTGGLLHQIGPRGMLICKDFTSMLSLPAEVFSETVAGLRDTFDGLYTRPTGVDGGRTLTWRGKIGFMGAVTPEIDRLKKSIQEMGERWVYYRFDDNDGYGATMKALSAEDQARDMKIMQDMVEGFFVELGVRWFNEPPRRELTDKEKNRLYTIASFTALARSSVPRDPYTGEVVDIASAEAPPRLANELAQLYLGLERIGIEEPETRWALICKLAQDSTKQLRARLLMDLWKEGGSIGEREMKARYKVGRRTAAMVMEDLAIHGLLDMGERTVERNWVQVFYEFAVTLSPKGQKLLDMGWGGMIEEEEEEDEYEEKCDEALGEGVAVGEV